MFSAMRSNRVKSNRERFEPMRSLRMLAAMIGLGVLGLSLSGCDKIGEWAKNVGEQMGVIKKEDQAQPAAKPGEAGDGPAAQPGASDAGGGPGSNQPGTIPATDPNSGASPEAQNAVGEAVTNPPASQEAGQPVLPSTGDNQTAPQPATQPGTQPASEAPTNSPAETPRQNASNDPGPATNPATNPPTLPVNTPTEPAAQNPTNQVATTEPGTTPTPPKPAPIPFFSFHRPGLLLERSGTGATSRLNYAPIMLFPIATHRAYLGSQVYKAGGGLDPQKRPDQCDASNFAYPWQDNFCEKRTRDTTNPFCGAAKGVHLGVDIRAGDPGICRKMVGTKRAERKEIPVIAVEDGDISNVGSYSVTLRSEGRTYRYLHLNMAAIAVKAGQAVKAGDLIGYLSNDFGVDSAGKPVPTTLHLHFEIRANVEGQGFAMVPPYTALLAAYERRENGIGQQIENEESATAAQ